MHGGATEKSCRCIDDMLDGEQNGTVGTVSSHRPTDPDGLVAQVRATRRRFPEWQLSGWPCDLEKAYKQVAASPEQLRLAIIVMWCATMGCSAFFIPLCQLVGGKSPPLNFARFPAWLCEVAASLFARIGSFALRRRHQSRGAGAHRSLGQLVLRTAVRADGLGFNAE